MVASVCLLKCVRSKLLDNLVASKLCISNANLALSDFAEQKCGCTRILARFLREKTPTVVHHDLTV